MQASHTMIDELRQPDWQSTEASLELIELLHEMEVAWLDGCTPDEDVELLDTSGVTFAVIPGSWGYQKPNVSDAVIASVRDLLLGETAADVDAWVRGKSIPAIDDRVEDIIEAEIESRVLQLDPAVQASVVWGD
jgi:hypothetical protein